MNFDFLSGYNIWAAFWVTIQLTLYSAIGALIWGTILAAMRVSPVPAMRAFGTLYVNIFRNTPLTLIILAMSLVISNKLLITFANRRAPGGLDLNNFRLAIVGFIIYTASFVCESIRSGINTVPAGQAEAARAIGLKFTQVLGVVILPQALRAVIAPLASVLIALTKNTTVAAAIGVAEAGSLMRVMMENESNALFGVFAIFAFGFIVLTLPIGLILGNVAKRLSVKR